MTLRPTIPGRFLRSLGVVVSRTTGIWVEALSEAGFGMFDYPASGQWDPGWQVVPADLNADGNESDECWCRNKLR